MTTPSVTLISCDCCGELFPACESLFWSTGPEVTFHACCPACVEGFYRDIEIPSPSYVDQYATCFRWTDAAESPVADPWEA